MDATTDDYYGPGNAERVAAARASARRKLISNTSRDSSTTAPDTTPGSAAGAQNVPSAQIEFEFCTGHLHSASGQPE